MNTATSATGGLAIVIVGAIAAVLVEAIKAYRRRDEDRRATLPDADPLAELTAKVDQVLSQVANTHTTNLRDDIDAKFAGLEQTVRDQLAHINAAMHQRFEGVDRRVTRLAEDSDRRFTRVDDRLDRHIDHRTQPPTT